ncbi:MAG: hypothetical protein WCX32_03265 [Clostridia bacterium]|jgi:hypothetical protein|nr:hypothetical protein [Clostridia bacterium]MDD4275496.1 hypothetical protein [Clostridia bacterium]
MQKFGPYNFVKFNNKTTADENSGQNAIADLLNTLGQNSNTENNTNQNSAGEPTEPLTENKICDNDEEFVTPKKSTHFISDQKKLLTAIKPNDKIAPKPNFHLWE